MKLPFWPLTKPKNHKKQNTLCNCKKQYLTLNHRKGSKCPSTESFFLAFHILEASYANRFRPSHWILSTKKAIHDRAMPKYRKTSIMDEYPMHLGFTILFIYLDVVALRFLYQNFRLFHAHTILPTILWRDVCFTSLFVKFSNDLMRARWRSIFGFTGAMIFAFWSDRRSVSVKGLLTWPENFELRKERLTF